MNHRLVALTNIQSDEIRRLYKTGDYYQRDLAKMYGVTQRVIWEIVNNLSYNNRK